MKNAYLKSSLSVLRSDTFSATYCTVQTCRGLQGTTLPGESLSGEIFVERNYSSGEPFVTK